MERVVLWASRLALPAVAGLLGQVLYWFWFDPYMGNRVARLVGGLSLGVVLVLVLALALASWCFREKK
jgi:hypothetical protein